MYFFPTAAAADNASAFFLANQIKYLGQGANIYCFNALNMQKPNSKCPFSKTKLDFNGKRIKLI